MNKKQIHIIRLFALCTWFISSCTNNNAYIDINDKARVDTLLRPIIATYNSRLDYVNSLRVIDSMHNKEQHPTIWFHIFYYTSNSVMNYSLQNYQLGINYADTLIDIIERNKFQKKLSLEYGDLYLQKGNGYFGLNNFAKAYQNYFNAKQIIEQYGDSCGKVGILSNISLVLYRQEQYETSKKSYFETLACRRTCSNFNEFDEQQNLDDIALCYTKLNQLDSADYYYHLALNNIEKFRYITSNDSTSCMIRYASCKGVILGNLAKIYALKNLSDSAVKLYKESIQLHAAIGFEKRDAQLCQEQLARIQLKEKDFLGMKQSLDDLKKGLDSLPNTEAELGWRELMATYFQNTNNHQKEIYYYKNFIAFRDSINLSKTGSHETTITKELKEKEQQFKITVLQKDNQLGKVYLWIVAILSIMTVIIAFLVFRNYRKGKRNIITLTNLNNQISQQQKTTEYALQQLEVSNKDKDRILRVVAHDLRNPISGIAAMSQAILEQDNEIENKDLIKLIENTSNHSLTLINELLQTNSNKNESLHLQSIDINQLVKQTTTLLNYKALEKKQKINLSLLSDSLLVDINENKIDRVIGNLITNAIKFSPKHSIISISINKNENNVIISIKDDGIGIPETMKLQIFEMHGKIKRKGTEGEKSFGLGLSICKQIIEQHQGKIWVESKEGKGSVFYVQLSLGNNM